jgi:hypothetical protein
MVRLYVEVLEWAGGATGGSRSSGLIGAGVRGSAKVEVLFRERASGAWLKMSWKRCGGRKEGL